MRRFPKDRLEKHLEIAEKAVQVVGDRNGVPRLVDVCTFD
jgi:hypothetical protein